MLSEFQECRAAKLATSEGAVDYGAMPSVISILVPHGSVMNATRIVLTKLLGVSP